MTKAAHFLTSLLFVIVCAALWFVWKLGAGIQGVFVGESDHPQAMAIALMCYPWLLALPAPCVVYSAVLMDRVELLPEKVLLYFVVMSLISTILVLGTIILFGLQVATMTLTLGGS
jgi:hypothetical protein